MSDTDGVTFANMGLESVLLQRLADLKYETPTPIQAAAIPVLLRGSDVEKPQL